jgi:hypothetical protein
MEHTTLQDLIDGEEILKVVSAKRKIPIVYTIVEETKDFDYDFEGETIELSRYVARKWL